MIVSVLPEAEMDIEDASEWYERRSEGLGSSFRESVEREIDTMGSFPRIHPVVHAELRRAPVARYPYSIIYTIERQKVIVIGVFHNSRELGQWQSRL